LSPGTIPETARRIREAQRAKGMTNEALARRTGVALRTVMRWRNGERPPRLANLMRLADALDVPSSCFIEDADRELAVEDLVREISAVNERTEVLAARLSRLELLVQDVLRNQFTRDGVGDARLEVRPARPGPGAS